MDGKTVARMRLLERTNGELTAQNTYMSAQVLRMNEQMEAARKASQVDRLLTGALLRHFTIEGRVEIAIAEVDALRLELGTPPGLSVHTTKDAEREVWVVELKENPPTDDTQETPSERPNLIVVP